MPGLLFESRAEQAVAEMNSKYTILSSDEVAEKILANESRTLLIDCRSLFAFTSVHIKGAIHVNCSSIGRKRLLQGKTKLKDLISSQEGKEKYISSSIQSFIVYDELTSSEDFASSKSAICIVLQTLSKEGKDISFLKGENRTFYVTIFLFSSFLWLYVWTCVFDDFVWTRVNARLNVRVCNVTNIGCDWANVTAVISRQHR